MDKTAQAQMAALIDELKSTQVAVQTLTEAINDLAAQMKARNTRSA